MVHIHLGGRLDVLVAQDGLRVFHGPVLLQIGAQRTAKHLESAEISRDAKFVTDGPHLPLEEVLRTKRNGEPLIFAVLSLPQNPSGSR